VAIKEGAKSISERPDITQQSSGRALRAAYFDLASGLFVPLLIAWDPKTGEFNDRRGAEGIRDVAGGRRGARFLATRGPARADESQVILPALDGGGRLGRSHNIAECSPLGW
jgi:hypothetical protein